VQEGEGRATTLGEARRRGRRKVKSDQHTVTKLEKGDSAKGSAKGRLVSLHRDATTAADNIDGTPIYTLFLRRLLLCSLIITALMTHMRHTDNTRHTCFISREKNHRRL
jgi:hypothetical protein